MKDLKIFTNNIEESAKEQIDLLLEQEPFKECKIRIMPDVHAGAGCVIGFTGDLKDKIIPNIVGVDIGCGMLCVGLGNINLDLKQLDKIIHSYVPSGFDVHDERKEHFEKLQDLKCYRELKDTKRIERSLGTLGGGNHFIEVDIDDDNNKYLVIHTGSRNLGKQVAEYYQDLADKLINYNQDEYFEMKQKIIQEYKEQGRKTEIQDALKELSQKYNENKNKIPKELCYLEGKYRDDYLHDMVICQEFAHKNRREIAKTILNHLGYDINLVLSSYDSSYGSLMSVDKVSFDWFESVHNYLDFHDNIIRKGAIFAKKGKTLIIPMNMRDGCIIGIGKGNDDWNQSAPHGAGRTMSRNMARDVLNMEEFKETMNGIYTTSVNEGTIDESPMAYKPMEEIIDYIKDTVEITKIIKPIYNFKASE